MNLDSYIFRSLIISVVILCFYLMVYRNDNNYNVIRYYFLFGIASIVLLPLLEISYKVIIPISNTMETNELFKQVSIEDNFNSEATTTANSIKKINWFFILQTIYFIGVALLSARLIFQLLSIYKEYTSSEKVNWKGAVICIHPAVKSPFTLGNKIFVGNHSYLEDNKHEVLVHERVHLKQNHWIDMFLSEIISILFWFNPFTWYINRLIKQNLEFIADQGVLDSGIKIKPYIRSIICETMGAEAIVLANYFRDSRTKKRLKMMKKVKRSKWGHLKLLLLLPLISAFLWAFKNPVYVQEPPTNGTLDNTEVTYSPENGMQKKDAVTFHIKGNVNVSDTLMVLNKETGNYDKQIIVGNLPKTTVVAISKENGQVVKATIVDKNGQFGIDVKEGDKLVFSYIGYETQEILISNNKELNVIMKKATLLIDPGKYRAQFKGKILPPPPPPPPVEVVKNKKADKVVPPPPPPPVSKGDDDEPIFFIVEEMPEYIGGIEIYWQQLYSMAQYESEKTNLKGSIKVAFTVDENGTLQNVRSVEKTNTKESQTAVDIVSKLDQWKPGKQRGNPVSCNMLVEVEFE